jgi:wobble nucleotide-excising tRNase
VITEIRMDDVASFKHNTSLATDKKVNLIYGLNGTGKSTISDFLYDSANLRFAQCRRVPEQSDPILVYNQSFIRQNFFVLDNLKGIFSLSKENKTAEEKITKATATLSDLEQRRQTKRAAKQQVAQAFDTQKQQAADEVWKIKTTYSGGDRVLEYCLDGLKGQKDKLFAHLHSTAKPESEPKKSIQALREEVEALKGESAQSQPILPALNFAAQDVEFEPILGKSIVGNTDSEVAALIEKLGNADWVKQGLAYLPEHADENGQPCPFCQEKTITLKLVDSVKNYFDETYQGQMDTLEHLRKKYVAARNELLDVSTYTNHKSASDRVVSLSKKHQELLDILGSNVASIEKKIQNPKLPQALKNSAAVLSAFNDEVKAINANIQTYNDRLKHRETVLKSLRDDFWSIIRWQCDPTIARFEKDCQTANQQMRTLDEDIGKIDTDIISARAQIGAAQKETVNVDEAVDAINAGLLDLGIDDFKITKHSESLYRVVRAGESEDAFHTLSEGEKMMISFLYFCELCKGRSSAEDTQGKRIVVIDDPISSLSHVFVFNVGQLIRSVFFKSDRFSQVFVLTHSLYFFYELTDPNHDRRKESQKLFRISKPSSGSDIQEMKYEEIQNDYQAYWSVINDPTHSRALIANCMRNIVEYFFNFVRKKDLNNVFLMPELHDVKFQAFCRYVNRESHSLGQNIIGMKEFDYGVFKEGLRLVFEKTGYPDHFKAMSKV